MGGSARRLRCEVANKSGRRLVKRAAQRRLRGETPETPLRPLQLAPEQIKESRIMLRINEAHSTHVYFPQSMLTNVSR